MLKNKGLVSKNNNSCAIKTGILNCSSNVNFFGVKWHRFCFHLRMLALSHLVVAQGNLQRIIYMKHTLGALLIFGLVAGLSACGGGGGSKPQPNEIPSSSSISSAISSSPSSSVSNSSVASSLQVSSLNSSSGALAKVSALVSGSVYLKDIDDGA